LLCGLITAKKYADAVISLDADLQDDVNVIDKMVHDFLSGNEIVYGVRADRRTDSAFKKIMAQGFYKVIKMLGADIVYNHADYRLMGKKALDALADFTEVNLFLRGMVPLLGFNTSTVEYKRAERFAGESKYSLNKMLSFAFEGITSLSIRPVNIITTLGIFIAVISIGMLVYSVIGKISGYTEFAWASIIASIWAIGGLNLFAIGIIGEYAAKTYLESKHRPRYIIEKVLITDFKEK
jgi:glycosyltransferase involved in cell wall biosynthesis